MSMGGSAVALTADVAARAIIAAARVFGDDPAKALTAKRGPQRRCLAPTAWALHEATGRPLPSVVRILGCNPEVIRASRKALGPRFDTAAAAAARALSYAAWRPEARESVVAGEGEDAVEQPADEAPPARPMAAEIILPPAPPEPQRPRASPPGRIVSQARLGMAPPSPLPSNERPVRDLVLEALQRAEAPMSSMSLASAVDRKEMAVVSALSQLAAEHLAESHPVTDGPRKLAWALTTTAQAAA